MGPKSGVKDSGPQKKVFTPKFEDKVSSSARKDLQREWQAHDSSPSQHMEPFCQDLE
jgi:hypothetical protein